MTLILSAWLGDHNQRVGLLGLGYLASVDRVVSHSTDSLLRATSTRSHTTDSYIERSKRHTTDSLLHGTITKTHSTDAYRVSRAVASHSTDSYKISRPTIAHSTDSYKVGTRTVVHSTDSLLHMNSPLRPNAWTISRNMQAPTLLSVGTSELAYRVYIAGADRTEWIRVGSSNGPGISISATTNSRATCTFTVNGWTHDTNHATIAVGSQYIPQGLDSIQIVRASDGLIMFRGQVDTTKSNRLIGDATAVQTAVSCIDFGIICDRRICGMAFFGAASNGLVQVDLMLSQIVQQSLAGSGISLIFNQAIYDKRLGPQAFTYITVTEAFNTIAQQLNLNWAIDTGGALRFYDPVDGWSAAPQDITDTTAEVLDLSISRTRVKFANRYYAKSSNDLGALWTDTITVGSGGYNTGWPQILLSQPGPSGDQLPEVTVNGVAEIVIKLPVNQLPQNSSYGWIYTGIAVGRSPFASGLSNGDIVRVIYPSPLPYVAIAEDLTSIADVGLFEDTIEAGEITDKNTLQDIADNALLRGKVVPVTLAVRTRTDGYWPGQRLSVTRSDPPVSGDFLVTQVNSREIGQHYFEHTLTLNDKTAQLASLPNSYLGNIIKNTRMRTYNIIEHITFNLAVTVTGLTNPGLAVGVPPAVKTAQKKGVAGWVTLIFNSCAQQSTVTVTEITIDILQNGSTIFGAKKLTYPAGFQGETKFSIFLTDPLPVAVGDVFTCNVLTADDQAYDGVMELVTVG